MENFKHYKMIMSIINHHIPATELHQSSTLLLLLHRSLHPLPSHPNLIIFLKLGLRSNVHAVKFILFRNTVLSFDKQSCVTTTIAEL